MVDLHTEMMRSQPDFVVYCPKSVDGSSHDTGNEHFLVFDGPDGALMAVWTQSTAEGGGDHRIVFARSDDDGRTWSAPRLLVGSPRPGEGRQASWGFPLLSRSGRIYVLYNQFQGVVDYHHQVTGTMDGIFSDDAGRTWSTPETLPMRRSPYDHPDPGYPSNWIVWQRPNRDRQGRWLAGFTRWVSPQVRTKPERRGGWLDESVVEFMRFENLDADPRPRDIRVANFAFGDQALRIPHFSNPHLSIAQEPSLVYLPDGRLFAAMRSMTGYVWYSLSADDGATWCNPRPLLRRDKGLPIQAPICCTPIYRLAGGKYILFHQDNNGFIGDPDMERKLGAMLCRRPCAAAVGEFRPGAEQPLWFSESRVFMDNDGVPLGPLKRLDIGVYPSMTHRQGRDVLWHPERKFFLLGKIVPPEFVAGLAVPG